jgi:zinc protease
VKNNIYRVFIVLILSLSLTGCTCLIGRCDAPRSPFPEDRATAAPVLPDPNAIAVEPLDFDPPAVERVVLDNGMVLFFMEDRELPLVKLSLIIQAGSVFDPPGLEGLAALTGKAMIRGGTSRMTPDEVDDELDFLAADISVSVGKKTMVLSVDATTDTFDRALEIFNDILHHPRFSEQRLANVANVTVEDLRRIPDNPQRLAFRELSRLLYDDERWGRSPTINSVRAITRDHCEIFHKNFIQSGPSMAAVSGDVSLREIRKKLNDLLGSRCLAEAEPLPEPPVPRELAAGYYLSRDLPQSVIVAGYVVPGKNDPDFYAMNVLNDIAGGGGFQSRMTTEIRTRRGLAYSVGSIYEPKSDFGVVAVYAMTRSEATASVVELMNSILEDLAWNPVDTEALERSRKSLINSHVFSFTSASKITRKQMMNAFQGLPDNFLQTYTDRIASVDAEDVRRSADAYLGSNRRVLLVLGHPDSVKEQRVAKEPLVEIRSDLLEEVEEL